MNETLIFQAIERMREIVKSASNKTKSARRLQEKTENHQKEIRTQKKARTQSKKLSTQIYNKNVEIEKDIYNA